MLPEIELNWEDMKRADANPLISSGDTIRMTVTDPELKELPREVVDRLQISNITHLVFSGNKLEHWPSDLSALNHLLSLEVSNNGLTTFPEAIVNLENIVALNLSNNGIEVIPEQILKLKKLEVFNISNNNIAALADCVGNLINLKQLNISSNKLENLPDSLHQLKNLNNFKVSHNQMCRLPDCFFLGLNSIGFLDVANNNIEDVIAPPLCAPKLRELNLSNNLLSAIPEWMFVSCGSLLDLNLSHNSAIHETLECIESLTCNAGGMRSVLKRINLEGCKLTPDSFEFLTNFRSLAEIRAGNDHVMNVDKMSRSDFGMNMIWDIPVNVLACSRHLKELYLPAVGLAMLPPNISELRELKVLDLRSNELHFLNDELCQIRSLTTVLLSDNCLVTLPSQFGNLKDLIELRLDRNQISSLPDSFAHLGHLVYLDFYNNYLEELVPDSILNSAGLKGLDLEENICITNNITCCLPYDGLKTALRSHVNETSRTDGCKPPGVTDSPDIDFVEDTDYDDTDFYKQYSDEPSRDEEDSNCDIEAKKISLIGDEDWDSPSEDETDWIPPDQIRTNTAGNPKAFLPQHIFVKSNLATYDGQFDGLSS